VVLGQKTTCEVSVRFRIFSLAVRQNLLKCLQILSALVSLHGINIDLNKKKMLISKLSSNLRSIGTYFLDKTENKKY